MPRVPRLAPRLGTLVAVAALVTAPALRAQAPTPEPIRFARYAHVANDGRLAFTYHDDIWIADADGANPRRLTAHVARDMMPRFSPDGQWIAFTSNRYGNNDVFVMPVTGGEPRQLTWHSGDDQALYWTPDGREVVFSSGRGRGAWGSPLYRVALDGSIPRPMGMDIGRAGMIRQDATMVAFNRSLPSYWRKGYRGNANADIAVQDLASGEIRELTDTDLQQFRTFVHDVHPMWGADGKIYYASERDGIFNLWRIAPTGGAAEQVTRHADDGVQFPAISPDGRRIVYENDFALWTIDVPNGQPRKLDIRLALDPKETDVEVVTVANRADGFTVSPTGDYLAVDVRGEIMIVPTESGIGERTAVTQSPWRERFQAWSPTGRHIAYVSDESGEEEVWVYEVASGRKRKLTTHASVKGDLTWAPSGQLLAYTGANRLFEVDVTGGAPRELGHHPAGGYAAVSYGPDGNVLVYTKRDDDQNADVHVFDKRTRREVNVTRNPFQDSNGQLTPDGRHVVFTSTRDGATPQLFAVSLARVTEDPDDPLVKERQRRASGRTERPDSAGAATPAQAAAFRVDADGIERRAVQLTRGPVGVGAFFLSRDGRTITFTSGGGGFGGGGQAAPADPESPNTGLFQVNIDGSNRRRLAGGSYAGMTPTADGRTIFFRRAVGGGGGDGTEGGAAAGSEIHKLVLATPQRSERVAFSFPVRVDLRAEREQLFEEAWRVMKYRFYDEEMHGRDWNAIRARYKPLLRHVGTNEDLYDLANEMIGELNASHTGVNGPPSRAMPRVYTTRYLGVELEEDRSGRYRISHVYRDGPADKEWLGLAIGDYVLAIDGQELKAGDNYWKVLSTTLNEYIPVRVAKAASGEGARTVRIRSVTSLGDIKYEEWVAERREIVERETKGEIAYVHIRAMNQPSLVKFRNEIDQFSNRKGIIVDIRYNGGGNIDQELIDILEREPYQFWNQRTGARTWGRRPRQAIPGPKVMLINQRSGSDSEVTPMAFRQLGLGRIVGHPTAAAVIATGSYTLINGATIRTPGSLVVTYDATKPNNYGINLENYGVPPDVWVRNSPMDELRKDDKELTAAIEEVLRMLKEYRPRGTAR
jgi:tricorn protease